MSNFGIKVSKEGVDVKTASNKDLLISSEFDTFKVFRTGSIVLNMPNETLSEEQKSYTATYTHNLGYVPAALPIVSISGFAGNVAPIDENWWETGRYKVTSPYIVNDISDIIVNPGIWGAGPTFVHEGIRTEINSTQLKLIIDRVCFLGPFGGEIEFTASQATLYYTIFHNRVDEEFDLLS